MLEMKELIEYSGSVSRHIVLKRFNCSKRRHSPNENIMWRTVIFVILY